MERLLSPKIKKGYCQDSFKEGLVPTRLQTRNTFICSLNSATQIPPGALQHYNTPALLFSSERECFDSEGRGLLPFSNYLSPKMCPSGLAHTIQISNLISRKNRMREYQGSSGSGAESGSSMTRRRRVLASDLHRGNAS